MEQLAVMSFMFKELITVLYSIVIANYDGFIIHL